MLIYLDDSLQKACCYPYYLIRIAASFFMSEVYKIIHSIFNNVLFYCIYRFPIGRHFAKIRR